MQQINILIYIVIPIIMVISCSKKKATDERDPPLRKISFEENEKKIKSKFIYKGLSIMRVSMKSKDQKYKNIKIYLLFDRTSEMIINFHEINIKGEKNKEIFNKKYQNLEEKIKNKDFVWYFSSLSFMKNIYCDKNLKKKMEVFYQKEKNSLGEKKLLFLNHKNGEFEIKKRLLKKILSFKGVQSKYKFLDMSYFWFQAKRKILIIKDPDLKTSPQLEKRLNEILVQLKIKNNFLFREWIEK